MYQNSSWEKPYILGEIRKKKISKFESKKEAKREQEFVESKIQSVTMIPSSRWSRHLVQVQQQFQETVNLKRLKWPCRIKECTYFYFIGLSQLVLPPVMWKRYYSSMFSTWLKTMLMVFLMLSVHLKFLLAWCGLVSYCGFSLIYLINHDVEHFLQIFIGHLVFFFV